MLYPPLKSISLEKVPRLFLNRHIPGYVSEAGQIYLPLHLDGSLTDTGLLDQTNERERFSITAYFSDERRFFANRSPTPWLYKGRDKFEEIHRPRWLQKTATIIADKAEQYFKVRRSERTRRENLIAPFYSRWMELQQVIKGALYMGENLESHKIRSEKYVIYPHDLCLYGPPLTLPDPSLLGLLHFIDAFLKVDMQLRTGMAQRVTVVVQHGASKAMRELFDPIEDQIQKGHEGVTYSHDDSPEIKILLPLREVRPEQVVEADRGGTIPLSQLSRESEPPLDPDYGERAERQNSALLGIYLFIHHRLSPDHVDEMTDKFHDFQEKGDPDYARIFHWLKNYLMTHQNDHNPENLDVQVQHMIQSLIFMALH